jgi:hypothetical protein
MKETKAPWNEDQVKSLNDFQQFSNLHPFTCSCHATLVATPNGWNCPDGCSVSQDWCWDMMSDWTWKRMAADQERIISSLPESLKKLC